MKKWFGNKKENNEIEDVIEEEFEDEIDEVSEEYYEEEESEEDEEEYYEEEGSDEEESEEDEEEYYEEEESEEGEEEYYEEDEPDGTEDAYYGIEDIVPEDEEEPTRHSLVGFGAIIAAGICFVVLAAVTGVMFWQSKAAEKQVAAFATVGTQLDGIEVVGEEGLLAVADAATAAGGREESGRVSGDKLQQKGDSVPEYSFHSEGLKD